MKNFHIYLNDKCLFKNLNQEEFDVIWGRIYHSYFKEECLFKNLNQEEFDVIWGRIYKSYFKDDLTYVECIDDACIQGKIEEHSY